MSAVSDSASSPSSSSSPNSSAARKQTSSGSPAPVGAAAPASDDVKARILLVEDHADTSRVMARLLERDGYRVQVVTTVAAALKVAQAVDRPFDLLISDIGLPDGTGIELMQQLMSRRPIKGIALSGFGMEEDVKRSRAAGFTEHLTKPINLQKLQSVIERITG